MKRKCTVTRGRVKTGFLSVLPDILWTNVLAHYIEGVFTLACLPKQCNEIKSRIMVRLYGPCRPLDAIRMLRPTPVRMYYVFKSVYYDKNHPETHPSMLSTYYVKMVQQYILRLVIRCGLVTGSLSVTGREFIKWVVMKHIVERDEIKGVIDTLNLIKLTLK